MSPAVPARERLLEERQRALTRVRELTGDLDSIVEAARDTNLDDEHDPEGATIAFERSQLATVLQQARDGLAEIDAALARLDHGTYGVCESCGRPIDPARLEARPMARVCVDH